MKFVTALFFCLTASHALAQLDSDLKITLETPQYKGYIGQIGQVRGWALHPTQIVDIVEIYIDGQFYSEVPVGGQRNDVYNAFPNAVNSRYSGWAQTVNFKDFADGYHSLEVRAYTTTNRYNSATGNFCVDSVPGGAFIPDRTSINFKSMELFHKAENALLLQKITIDGEFYNMEIQWDTASQGFIIEQVEPYINATDIQDTNYEGWGTFCEPEGE